MNLFVHSSLRPPLAVVLLAWLAANMCIGCVAHPPAGPQAPVKADNGISIRGRNGVVRFDFEAKPTATVEYTLADDELCYMPVGDGTLVCASWGSYLRFGPNDGVLVVRDNPAEGLKTLGQAASSTSVDEIVGVVHLLAASVDRLPDAVSDYLDNPGPHRPQAAALARKLLSDNGAVLIGAARGATFVVWLDLDATGRQTLEDSMLLDVNPFGVRPVGNNRTQRGDFPLDERRSSARRPGLSGVQTKFRRAGPGSQFIWSSDNEEADVADCIAGWRPVGRHVHRDDAGGG